MSWGYKILFVYLAFVAGIVFLVIKASGENQDLVITDYYEQELKYQDKIDETTRANALSAPVDYTINPDQLTINLPPEMKGVAVKATVLLYCIADKTKDVQNNFTTQNGVINLLIPPANKGLHELKITWLANSVSYYYQHKLLIP
ncbi:MAG: FixH family protein [Ferruginibacter sp.]